MCVACKSYKIRTCAADHLNGPNPFPEGGHCSPRQTDYVSYPHAQNKNYAPNPHLIRPYISEDELHIQYVSIKTNIFIISFKLSFTY